MRQRATTAAALVPVVAIPFLLGFPWLTLGIMLLAVLAAVEAADLVRRAGLPAHVASVVLPPVVAVLLTLSPETRGIVAVVPALTLLVAAFTAFRNADVASGLLGWVGGAFAAVWITALAFVPLVGTLPGLALATGSPLAGRLDAGRTWILILVLTVWACDTFAYVVGRGFPRGQMLPRLSPNKTWSGALGGTLAAMAACAALVSTLTDMGPAFGALLGASLAVAAQVGDAAESLLKRAAGAKDSGTLIPGHGGVLDRVDSFLFAAPVLFTVLSLLPWFGA